jgi:hypothetical protein
MISIQMIGMGATFVGIAFSFFAKMHIIKYLLYIQAVVLILSNYNGYVEENTVNFEGLNSLSMMVSLLLVIMNLLLANMVIESIWIKGLLTFMVLALEEFVIIQTKFIFGDITLHTKVTLWITIISTGIMVPAFCMIC